jgi:heat shock protein HtpX
MNRFGNTLRTFFFLGLLTLLVMLVGQLVGGRSGLLVAFAFAMVMNFVSYWFSDRMVLAMYRARPASPEEYPALHRMVGDLARRAGLPAPRIYIIPQEAPNAFATGRNPRHAALGVTEGILRILSPEELEGVLAHELAHVDNRDILVGSIAATMAGVIMYLAQMLQFAAFFGGGRSDDDEGGGVLGLLVTIIFAPLAAMLIQMAISRSREYGADSTGARLAGQPFGLAGALEKLARASEVVPMEASPATSHLFIVKPLSAGGLMSLFSTHPPIEERVRRLRSLNY